MLQVSRSLEAPSGSRNGDAEPSSKAESNSSEAAGNGAAPSGAEVFAAVLDCLAADWEQVAAGAAAQSAAPVAESAADSGAEQPGATEAGGQPGPGARLQEAAEAAMQRGAVVFGFPESECCKCAHCQR